MSCYSQYASCTTVGLQPSDGYCHDAGGGDNHIHFNYKTDIKSTCVVSCSTSSGWWCYSYFFKVWTFESGQSDIQCINSNSASLTGTFTSNWGFYCSASGASSNSVSLPTVQPTRSPTIFPTIKWTDRPTQYIPPTRQPTISPSLSPSSKPTHYPTYMPSYYPTISPTLNPTLSPTLTPTLTPTINPTINPTFQPSWFPSEKPSFSNIEVTAMPSQVLSTSNYIYLKNQNTKYATIVIALSVITGVVGLVSAFWVLYKRCTLWALTGATVTERIDVIRPQSVSPV